MMSVNGLALRGQPAATVIDGQGYPVSSEMLLDVLARMDPDSTAALPLITIIP